MNELVLPCLSYAVLMTFTPGPNNVSSSTLGLGVGYRKSLPYLLGIATGFIIIMLGAGLLTEFLTKNYAAISFWIKWVGVVYMVWLAISPFIDSLKKRGGAGDEGAAKSGNAGHKDAARDGLRRVFRDGYVAGFLLQFVNPKGLLYGITIYVSFSPLLTGSVARTIGSATFLTAIGFVSISAWCLVGSAFARLFAKPKFKLGFNIVMSALLVYSAVTIALH
jgi:cysteine/O-acetylserine efflux protein